MLPVFLTSLNTKGGMDWAFTNPFGQFIQPTTIEEAEYVFVVLMHTHEWEMNEDHKAQILASQKPIIVFDFWELGWSRPQVGVLPFMLDFSAQIKAYFKREFYATDKAPFPFYPIDFYNFLEWPTVDSAEQFADRPIDILMVWGYSHPLRPQVHGAIFSACATYGWNFITNPAHMEHEKPPYAVLLHQPWYDRRPMDSLLELQSKAKITISLPGAGAKCFRHNEIVNSIMAKVADKLVWQAGWDETNCIEVVGQAENWPPSLKRELSNPEALYQKYLKGVEVNKSLKPERVWNEYLLPKIAA